MKNKIIETLETLSEKRIFELTGAEISNLCYLMDSYDDDFFTSTQDGTGTIPEPSSITPEFIEKKYYPVLEEVIEFYFEQEANNFYNGNC